MAQSVGRPVLVELMGFPGCGKSSVVEAALELTARRGQPQAFHYGRDGKYRFARDDVRGVLPLLARTLAVPRGAGGPRPAGRRMRRFLPVVDQVILFQRVRRRHRDGAVVLFDQGLFQKLYLLASTEAPAREEIVALLERLRPDVAEVVVVLDTPPRAAASRYVARGKSSSRRPYKGWDEDRVAALYTAHAPVIPWIADWLEGATDTMVVRLDGREPARRNGALLADVLEAARSRAAPGCP